MARWGGCLLYVLLVPFCLLTACLLSLLLLAVLFGVGEYFHFSLELAGWAFTISFLFWLGAQLLVLLQEFRARNFQEIALEGSRLVVNGVPSELADVKVWPYGMNFTCGGALYLVRFPLPEEKKLQVLERLLPALVQSCRAELESTGELCLTRSWTQLFSAFLRGLTAGGLVTLLGLLAHPLLGMGLGLLVLGLVCRRPLQYFLGGGVILSPTGVRRLGESREQEAPWSELKSCWTGAYFQNLLRVSTRRGEFRLLSSRNPVVWALLIQELAASRD
ncbi:MAG: hypothetical protein KIS61_02750 [Candidatus Eremiobacteraeota bacterium]|nr:hypothetical protein [Candidatus Eremiobacteraeota bacterium]